MAGSMAAAPTAAGSAASKVEVDEVAPPLPADDTPVAEARTGSAYAARAAHSQKLEGGGATQIPLSHTSGSKQLPKPWPHASPAFDGGGLH